MSIYKKRISKDVPIDNLPNEEWRDVIGYEGFYAVSNMGRVKRLKTTQTFIKRGVPSEMVHFERLMTGTRHKQGYLYLELAIKHRVRKLIRVYPMKHRVVASSFIPNPENKKEVNHKNGIKDDNRVENLEWVTPSENMKHAYDNGLIVSKRGENTLNSTISDATAKKIKDMCDIKPRVSDINIGIEFNVSRSIVWSIRTGRSWTHV